MTPTLGAPPGEGLIEWVRMAILGLIPRGDHAAITVATARQRGRDGDVDTVHVRVVGPPHAVGRVIGRGGATYTARRHVVHRVAYINSLHVRLHVIPTGGNGADEVGE